MIIVIFLMEGMPHDHDYTILTYPLMEDLISWKLRQVEVLMMGLIYVHVYLSWLVNTKCLLY